MKRRTPPDKEPEPPESAVDKGNSRGPTPPQLATLFAALVCPLCHLSLRCPTTLACGHSLCAFHVTDLPDLNSDSPAKSSDPPAKPSDSPAKSLLLPRCPLPGCSASTPRRSSVGSTISTSSRVRYRPAPATDDAALPIQPRTVPDPRPDVSLNKVLSLVRHAKQALEASSDDGRPRKRQRHQSPDDDDEDLPGYVQRLASPSPSDGILSRFQKNLLAELTCEICFVLLYQPITTPCQHVRLIILSLSPFRLAIKSLSRPFAQHVFSDLSTIVPPVPFAGTISPAYFISMTILPIKLFLPSVCPPPLSLSL